MVIRIHTEAIKKLRKTANPSFVIIELSNGTIVDFAETTEEAISKCTLADSYGSRCKFYQSSVTAMAILRDNTKNVDVEHELKGIKIENLEPWWVFE